MTDFEKITPSEPQSEEPKQEPEKTAEISEAEKLKKRNRYIELAKELAEGGEQFPFPGLDSESKSYAKLKAADEKDPGYTTPIDELIEKLRELKNTRDKIEFEIDDENPTGTDAHVYV